MLEELKPVFLEGFAKKGHSADIGKKIWNDWERFGDYAFNKSHATCYALLAYQTAYLKANYPSEYMVALMTHHEDKADKVGAFIEECRALAIRILPPCVNYSGVDFSIEEDGRAIRFGLGAIRNMGRGAAELIVQERIKGGIFKSLFSFCHRLDLGRIGKKALESLSKGGALEVFTEAHRRQYCEAEQGLTLLDFMLRWKKEGSKEQQGLFSQSHEEDFFKSAVLSHAKSETPYTRSACLSLEKEALGFYVSGHPLDPYKFLQSRLCNASLREIGHEVQGMNMGVRYKALGMITEAILSKTKEGKAYYKLQLEDSQSDAVLWLWPEVYEGVSRYIKAEQMVCIEGHIQERKDRQENERRKFFQPTRIFPFPERFLQWIKHVVLRISADKAQDKAWQAQLFTYLEKNASTQECPIEVHLFDKESGHVCHAVSSYTLPFRHMEQVSRMPSIDMDYVLR